MENINSEISQAQPSVKVGHLGVIALAAVLLLGVSYMEKPQLFSFKKTDTLTNANVPHYYAYVAPPTDDQPQVLGDSTSQGPSIINDDGSVQPVDMGQVLAASTQGVELSPQDIKVNAVPNSPAAVQTYFSQAQTIESGFAGDAAFADALTSGNQDQINQYAQQLTNVRDALQKIEVPQDLVKLQQLQIIQYNSAIQMLQNFTQANQNPDLITQDMEQFLKSEQDLESENISVAQKYASVDPAASAYVDQNGNPLPTPTPDIPTNLNTADNSQPVLDNSDNSDAAQ